MGNHKKKRRPATCSQYFQTIANRWLADQKGEAADEDTYKTLSMNVKKLIEFLNNRRIQTLLYNQRGVEENLREYFRFCGCSIDEEDALINTFIAIMLYYTALNVSFD